MLTSIIGYPLADGAPRNFFRCKDGEVYDAVYDRLLLFLEKLFIIVRDEVKKLPTQVDTPLSVLWYNHLLEGDGQTRQRIYEKVVTTTEASLYSMSNGINEINRCVELP